MKRFPLLQLDPELAKAVPARDRKRAEGTLLVPLVTVAAGNWEPPRDPPRGTQLGLLVVEGQLVREVILAHARSVELLGPGDLIRPWQEDACSFCNSRWRILAEARLAVLDAKFERMLAQWPSLVSALIERTLRRSRFLAAEAAVSNLVGVDKRVLSLLWQLAERWGQVDDDGVVVTIRLTHQMLAEIVGARRPSVTQALGHLVENGEVTLRLDGCWVLKGQPLSPEDPGLVAREIAGGNGDATAVSGS